jgi:hypothetical protein
LKWKKKEKLKMLDGIEKKLKNPDVSKLSIVPIRLLSYKMFSPYMIEKIDLKKPLEERFSIEMKDTSALTPDFKNELMKYKEQYLSFVKNDVDKFLEKGLYSEAEQKQLFKTRLIEMRKKYNSASERMDKFEKEDIAKRIEEYQDDLQKTEGSDLPVTLINIANLEVQIANYSENKPGFANPACLGEKCNDYLKKYIQESNMISSIQKARIDLENNNQSKALNQCKANVVSRLSIASDMKKAEKLVVEVKDMMKKNVFSKFSAHSRKMLEDYFNERIVTSNKSFLTLFSKDNPYDVLNTIADDQKKYVPGTSLANDENAILEANNIIEGSTSSLDISNVCPEGLKSNAYDTYVAWDKVKALPEEYKKLLSNLPPKDHIFISPFSCHHDLRGKSVVAHELGHAINQIFATQKLSAESAKTYKEIRKCATDNYTEFIPDSVGLIHEDDALRTEEDTADLFAFMTYSAPDDLFSCAIIKPALDNKKYDEPSFINDDGDTHSTGIYRLIMEAINKNKVLPVSCQRALETVSKDLRLNKCVP